MMESASVFDKMLHANPELPQAKVDFWCNIGAIGERQGLRPK
jgi:hypothetical protein